MSINLSRIFIQAVGAAALTALVGCVTPPPQIIEKSVCDEKCFAALNVADKIETIRVLSARITDFRVAGDTANMRVMTTWLNRYLELTDPNALKAANITRAQLGLEDSVKRGDSVTLTVQEITRNPDGTQTITGPMTAASAPAQASPPPRAANAPLAAASAASIPTARPAAPVLAPANTRQGSSVAGSTPRRSFKAVQSGGAVINNCQTPACHAAVACDKKLRDAGKKNPSEKAVSECLKAAAPAPATK